MHRAIDCDHRLAGDILHYTVRSFAEHEANVDRYTTLAAQQMFAQGKRSWRGALWFATPWSWFQNFVLRGGFLDGLIFAGEIAIGDFAVVEYGFYFMGVGVDADGETWERPSS